MAADEVALSLADGTESETPAAEHYVALDDDSEGEVRGDNGESEGEESDEQDLSDRGDADESLRPAGHESEASSLSIGSAPAVAEAARWESFTPAAPAASPALPPSAAAEDDFGDFIGDASADATAGDGGASFADFGAAFGEMPNFVTTDGPDSLGVRTPAQAGPAAAPLAASDVKLIKETMAALIITPPPWIRKMEQLRAVQQAQAALAAGWAAAAGSSCGASVEGSAPGNASVDVSRHWEVQVSARAGELLPDAKHLLTGDTIAKASPFRPVGPAAGADAAEQGASSAGVGGMPSGLAQFMAVPVARKKVTGRQLAAERRKEREERSRKQAAEAAGTA
jgi:hypothetical protein